MTGFYRTVTHPDGTASLEWVPAQSIASTSYRRYRALFPNGVPLRGDLTPEQQAWLKGASA